MPSGDPTLDFLDRLNDPSKWVIRRNVPLFKPHVRKGSDRSEFKVTAYDLAEISANTSELERKHGVVGRITPGHIQPGKSEEEQPTLYGFLRNPRVGKFGPKGEPALLVDCYYFPEHAGRADRFPFRSAEYYPAEKTIRGMALLTRDPFLDLGVVTYSERGPVHLYMMEGDMPEPEGGTKPEAKPEETPTPETTDGQNQDITPDEMALFDKVYKYFMMKGYMGAPGGGNVAPPTMPPQQPVVPMSKDKEPELYVKLTAKIEALEKAKAESDVELLLQQLTVERYQFDRDFERGELLKKNSAERQAYLKNLRARYTRVPEGEIQVYQGHVEGGDQPPTTMTKEQMEKALAYSARHDCDFIEAREAILSKRN